MAQALYRTYRPQTFDLVLGQEHVTKTLQEALKRNRVRHAYVFSGPRGTGKTTVARLLARALNCENNEQVTSTGEPCNTCASCVRAKEGAELDLIEIDAASNRGIDEIRELRERVRFAPAKGRKKVFLIDEFHMLTKEAFNALLKTLEEPPEHAVFILATTELHQVPQTILSRAQQYSFVSLKREGLRQALQYVIEKESIAIDDEALDLLITRADGSARDALSLLDVVSAVADAPITSKTVRTLLALPDIARVQNWFTAITISDAAKALRELAQAENSGTDILELARTMQNYVRVVMLYQVDSALGEQNSDQFSVEQTKVLSEHAANAPQALVVKSVALLTQAIGDVKRSPLPLVPLEIVTMQLCGNTPRKQPVPTAEPVKTQPQKIERSTEIKFEQKVEDTNQVNSLLSKWASALQNIHAENVGVAGLLRSAAVLSFVGGELLVAVAYPFYRERLMARHNKQLIEEHVEHVTGTKTHLSCKVLSELTEDEKTIYDKVKEQGVETESNVEPIAPEKVEGVTKMAVDLLGGQVLD